MDAIETQGYSTSATSEGLVTNAQYTYQPLKSPRNIRLLHIDNANEDDPLSGSFEEVDLDSFPQYHALSYTWGSGEATESVRVQGRVFHIFPNLFDSLRKLRAHGYTPVWIDRVCINQEDDGERMSQVMLMGRIYQSAKLVLVDLGGEIGHNGVETIVKMLGDFYGGRVAANDGLKYNFYERHFFPDYLCKYGLPKRGDLCWDTLRSFLAQPWFSRTWVLQEIVFATDFIVYCGADRISSETFLGLLQTVQLFNLDRFLESSVSTYNIHRGALIAKYRTACQELGADGSKQNPSLLELVIENRSSKCTDPRDHIFALLGMAREAVLVDLPPNYGETTVETYMRTARYFIGNGDGVALLHQAGTLLRRPNLPSWVPDWDVPLEAKDQVLSQRLFTTSVSKLFATGGYGNPSMTVGENVNILLVKGRIFDVISTLGAALPSYGSEFGPAQVMAAVEELGSMLKVLNQTYPSGENAEDVWWRTCVCDRHSQLDLKAPDEYRDLFRLWQITYSWEAAAQECNFEKFKDLSEKLAHYFPDSHLPENSEEITNLQDKTIEWQLGCLHYASRARNCLTSRGYICRVSPRVAVGDVVAVFDGVEVPYLLRPVGQNQYELLGNCYCHGIMYGEALNSPDFVVNNIEIL